MTTENWIALSALLLAFLAAFYKALMFIIKASAHEDRIKQLEDQIDRKDKKIERLREQIKEMN